MSGLSRIYTMPLLRFAEFRYLAVIVSVWLSLFFLTRSALLLAHIADADLSVLAVLRIYVVGLVYDLGFLLNACVPLALGLLLIPAAQWSRVWLRWVLYVLLFASVFAMLFVATSEWIFWDEFGVRFNFIAVDYLVYSKEVIDNILESYPVFSLLSLLAVIAVAIGFSLRRHVAAAMAAPVLPRTAAWRTASSLVLLVVVSNTLLGQEFLRGLGGNAYQRELASNGPFQFFAAFRNNEIDYKQFYATLPSADVARLLRAELDEPGVDFIGSDPLDIRRRVDNAGAPQNLNVVLVTIESLSAKYLGSFGDTHGLTPNLDALRQQSLFFTDFYATGTRTDRGLEAITLSIPPTPGRSIVKRIGRESGYASLGQQFVAHGYDSVFVYGGRGYFDNMNAFFSGNGYRIVDQSSVPETEIHFKNAWGMCDEDLYAQAMKIADSDHAAGKPFFLQLMTTSNHRPYTYPAGRIDIGSGDGRYGAVKYTDYAIGQFLAQARTKPWFSQTVFIFVADHTAGSAGREDLPVAGYRIPLFIYAPGHVAPGDFSGVVSQIDVAPTLLGLLNFDYVSTFFGRDVVKHGPSQRALVGNYQHLGLFDGKDLAILSPRKGMRRHDDALGVSRESIDTLDDPLLRRDVSYYEGASYAFQNGLLNWKIRSAVGAR